DAPAGLVFLDGRALQDGPVLRDPKGHKENWEYQGQREIRCKTTFNLAGLTCCFM
ncbi:uncharacterized, partial [Tachysurus ichikawai]